eukprot:SAG11_NODE_17463_length_518_cov_0.653938_1_plen_61_part_01
MVPSGARGPDPWRGKKVESEKRVGLGAAAAEVKAKCSVAKCSVRARAVATVVVLRARLSGE